MHRVEYLGLDRRVKNHGLLEDDALAAANGERLAALWDHTGSARGEDANRIARD